MFSNTTTHGISYNYVLLRTCLASIQSTATRGCVLRHVLYMFTFIPQKTSERQVLCSAFGLCGCCCFFTLIKFQFLSIFVNCF